MQTFSQLNSGSYHFGDFGAASMHHMLSSELQRLIKQIERRALIYFIDDLLGICQQEDKNTALYEQLELKAQASLAI